MNPTTNTLIALKVTLKLGTVIISCPHPLLEKNFISIFVHIISL